MRVLLDECLPRGLKKHLREHEVKTVPEAGWAGKKNGELLRLARGSVDVFVTIDSNLSINRRLVRFRLGWSCWWHAATDWATCFHSFRTS
jgi:predicted nuclease of predicted toxin-antitoxin system